MSLPPYRHPTDFHEHDGKLKMPIFGLGTWQANGEELKEAIQFAIKKGYRHIDTASIYNNEKAVGEAIREMIDEGLMTRQEIFITTKAWTNEIAPGKLYGSLKASLERLQLEYVDLYLAHMPTAVDHKGTAYGGLAEIWLQFHDVHERGLARGVGVSNWHLKQINYVMKLAKEHNLAPIQVAQFECHLYFPQKELVQGCLDHGIVVTSYASLGSPSRAKFNPPNKEQVKRKEAKSELDDENVAAIAKKYNKTPAQILLRYCLDRRMSIIPKSTNENRILENINIWDFSLTPEDMQKLEEKNISQRLFPHNFMFFHPQDPFYLERNPVCASDIPQ